MSELLVPAPEEHAFPLSKNRWVFNVRQEVCGTLAIFCLVLLDSTMTFISTISNLFQIAPVVS